MQGYLAAVQSKHFRQPTGSFVSLVAAHLLQLVVYLLL